MSVLNPDTKKYEEMDPEERKYEARRRITRMIVIRIAMSLMLLWVIFWFKLPAAMIVVLSAVIVLILGTLVPVIQVLRTTLQYEDEKETE